MAYLVSNSCQFQQLIKGKLNVTYSKALCCAHRNEFSHQRPISWRTRRRQKEQCTRSSPALFPFRRTAPFLHGSFLEERSSPSNALELDRQRQCHKRNYLNNKRRFYRQAPCVSSLMLRVGCDTRAPPIPEQHEDTPEQIPFQRNS